jgi:uncharacterized protein YbjQ (UPF0145 family)
MIVTTTEIVPGREIAELLGLARGNAVRARFVAFDIAAGLRNMIGARSTNIRA